MDWLLAGSLNIETIGNLKQKAAEIISCKALHEKYTVPQLLTILLECRRPLHPKAFRLLFVRVQAHVLSTYDIYIPDKIRVRVPVPDKTLLLALRAAYTRMLNQRRLPSPLTVWLVSCLSILPQKPPKVHQVLHATRPHVATDRTARWLTNKRGTPVRIAQLF